MIRLIIVILERVEPKEKKNAREKMERATAHFQPCVATLSSVATEGRGVPCLRARQRTRARGGGQGGTVATDLLEFSVAIENSLSRQR